jgi:hypothetical protein
VWALNVVLSQVQSAPRNSVRKSRQHTTQHRAVRGVPDAQGLDELFGDYVGRVDQHVIHPL